MGRPRLEVVDTPSAGPHRLSLHPRAAHPRFLIVAQVAHGATFEEILAGYLDLEREDIQQALEYAVFARDRFEAFIGRSIGLT